MNGEAFVRMPDGTLYRWHERLLDECSEESCERRHVSKAELNTFDETTRPGRNPSRAVGATELARLDGS